MKRCVDGRDSNRRICRSCNRVGWRDCSTRPFSRGAPARGGGPGGLHEQAGEKALGRCSFTVLLHQDAGHQVGEVVVPVTGDRAAEDEDEQHHEDDRLERDVGQRLRLVPDLHHVAPGEGERLLDEYQRRVDAFKRALGPNKPMVSVVRFAQGRVRAYAVGSFSGTVLEDAGLARPALQRADTTFVEVGRELIPRMDADVMFVCRFGDAGATEASFRQDPLWSRLEVVKRGAIHEVSDDHWMLGIGPLAAGRILDDLTTFVIGRR